MKLLCNKKITTENPERRFGSFSLSFSQNIDKIAEEWTKCCVTDTLMDVPFLETIEKHHPPSITPFYGLLYSDQEILGIFYFQIKKFKLSESLSFEDRDATLNGKFSNKIKRKVADFINFNTLILGNLLLTGQYGFKFVADNATFQKLSQKELPEKLPTTSELFSFIFNEALDYAKYSLGISCTALLCKDFKNDYDIINFKKLGFQRVEVQPNMIFSVRRTWKTFNDYLDSLQSKYRIRYRRAKKKLVNISKTHLSADDITKHSHEIEKLYLNIVKNADFNLFYLSQEFFCALKHNLKSDFTLLGYFKENKLVGFASLIKNFDEFYCFYLGYDPEINKRHQLYLNMLYDFIECAIDNQIDRIIMSRTAIEIKSSVGAVPERKFIYFRHNNFAVNSVFHFIFRWMYKNKEWKVRSPFK